MPTDGLPLFICTECHQKLLDSHSFRNQCIESVDKLRKIRLNINNVKKEDDDSNVRVTYFRLNNLLKQEYNFVYRTRTIPISPTHLPMMAGIMSKTIMNLMVIKKWETVGLLLNQWLM